MYHFIQYIDQRVCGHIALSANCFFENLFLVDLRDVDIAVPSPLVVLEVENVAVVMPAFSPPVVNNDALEPVLVCLEVVVGLVNLVLELINLLVERINFDLDFFLVVLEKLDGLLQLGLVFAAKESGVVFVLHV